MLPSRRASLPRGPTIPFVVDVDEDPYGISGWDVLPPTFRGQRIDKDLFGKLPVSEVFSRIRWGRSVDLDLIEWTIRSINIGIMAPYSDLLREFLQANPAVAGMVYRRVEQVAGATYDLLPAQDTGEDEEAKRICALAKKWLFRRRTDLEQLLCDLMWAEIDGRAASQIDWARVTGDEVKWAPEGYTWIHPGRLSFGRQRELRVVERYRQTGLYYSVGPALAELEDKFIEYMPRLFGDYPEREGCGPRMLYHLFFAKFGWRNRLELIELFSKGWKVVTADGSIESYVTSEAIQEGRDEAEKLGGENDTASFAPGVNFSVEWPHPEAGRIHEELDTDVEEVLAKLLLGQSKTTDGKSYGKGLEGMSDQQDIIKRSGGRRLGRVVTSRLLEPFVRLNVSPDAVHLTPTFKLMVEPEKDAAAEQGRLDQAIRNGVVVPVEVYREAASIREPKDGEPFIRWDPTFGTGGGARVVGGDFETPDIPPPPAPVLPPGAGGGGRPGGPPKGPGARPPIPAKGATAGSKKPGKQAAPAKPAREAKLEGFMLASSHTGGPTSLDLVLARGARDGAAKLEGWTRHLTSACRGLSDSASIGHALSKAADELPVDDLTPSIDRTVVRACMLGALEAHLDAEDAGDMGDGTDGGDERFHNEAPSARPFRLDLTTGPAGGAVNLVRKPFKEAIDWFAGKAVVPRAVFDRLRGEAKRRSFTVAGLARQALLETAHQELKRAMMNGDDLRTFSAQLGARFADAGFTALKPSHAELVYRNATMGAYASGRMEQMRQPHVLAARPFWQIRGVDDARTRPHHHAAHGKVIAASDGVWESRPPPWGHNCRCRLVSLSTRDVERRGLSPQVGHVALGGLPDEGWDTSSLLG